MKAITEYNARPGYLICWMHASMPHFKMRHTLEQAKHHFLNLLTLMLWGKELTGRKLFLKALLSQVTNSLSWGVVRNLLSPCPEIIFHRMGLSEETKLIL